jgi:hypothetical protein
MASSRHVLLRSLVASLAVVCLSASVAGRAASGTPRYFSCGSNLSPSPAKLQPMGIASSHKERWTEDLRLSVEI